VIYKMRVWLWEIIAELEYYLYPWKIDNPPEYIRSRFNLSTNETDYEENLSFDWLKSHDEKIGRLQTEMLWVQEEIYKLKTEIVNIKNV
jgi:hypothetical protein